MTVTAGLFWSFRSPYSYLGAARYRRMAAEYDLEIALRPVFSIAIRAPEFIEKVNPLWVANLLHDVKRVAEYQGLPFQFPSPDPVVMNMATREIAADQPYIYRITHLGLEAARRGKGLAFADEVSRAIWGDGVKDWHLDENLAPIVARAGLDLGALSTAIEGRHDALNEKVAVNQQALEKAGHWGVPCLVFQDEPFFGQDRIDMAIWRMEQHGLKRRG